MRIVIPTVVEESFLMVSYEINIMGLQNRFFSLMMNKWYDYISKLDVKGEVLFLNYGYQNKERLELKEEDEKNRYCIQLYHKVASSVKINDKEILEVGCGKGGGASYIARYLNPKMIIGLDRSKNEIEFNEKHYSQENLKFQNGDALNMPFSEESFDVLINVESSHGYVDFDKFLREVKRVLKVKGYFLFADFRKKRLMMPLSNSLKRSGFQIIKSEDITANVIEALYLDNERRVYLIKRFLPKFFHKWGEQFAGVKGSNLYHSFETGERKYFYFVLQRV